MGNISLKSCQILALMVVRHSVLGRTKQFHRQWIEQDKLVLAITYDDGISNIFKDKIQPVTVLPQTLFGRGWAGLRAQLLLLFRIVFKARKSFPRGPWICHNPLAHVATRCICTAP